LAACILFEGTENADLKMQDLKMTDQIA